MHESLEQIVLIVFAWVLIACLILIIIYKPTIGVFEEKNNGSYEDTYSKKYP
jgi:hypothetical protein